MVETGKSESVNEAWLEHTSDGDDVPCYNVQIEFLEKHMRTCTPKTPARINANHSKAFSPKKLVKAQVLHVKLGDKHLCLVCTREPHQLYQCPQFKEMFLE